MKKDRFKLKKIDKIIIVIMVITLAITILPKLDLTMFMSANNPGDTTILELQEGRSSRILRVSSSNDLAAQAVLRKDGKELQRSPISTLTPSEFVLYVNGNYQIQILDHDGGLLEEQTQILEDFEDLYVEKQEDGVLHIISRIEGTDHISVSFQKMSESLSVNKDDPLYEAEFTPKVNGTYVFQSEAADGSALGAPASYEETGIAEEPEPQEPVSSETNEIHITDEQGLRDIAKALDKTYILDRDITMTGQDASSIVLGTFTGRLNGNGHVIKDLKQPLFTSIENAVIYDINLNSTLSGKSVAALSIESKNSTIQGVGIMANVQADSIGAGMLVNSMDTRIDDCFVSGKIVAGTSASGFVSKGSAVITDSYVTGIIEADREAYGFGKQVDIKNSYAAVYVEGDESGNFNAEGYKLEGCFYDISTALSEEPRAQEYTSEQMISGTLPVVGFQQTGNSYPSLKKEVTDRYSEEAKKSSALSTLAVSTKTSLLGMMKDVTLPTSTGMEQVVWSAEGNVGVAKNTALAKITNDLEQDTSGELQAATTSGKRLFKAGSAKLLNGDAPVVGASLPKAATSISFNMKENHYYLITTDSDMKNKLPKDHKTAIEGGWRRYLWSGAITWDELEWNTVYYVYDYDLKGDKAVTVKSIKTVKGRIGGRIELQGEMSSGATITAALNKTNTTRGTWKWEKAESLTSEKWEVVQEETETKTSNTSSSYQLKETESRNYIRVTFTADDEKFEGTIQASGKTVVKAPLTSVRLYTDEKKTIPAVKQDMIVDKRLYALVEPSNFDADVVYTWHHYDPNGSDTVLGRGDSYQLRGRDVDRYIYVKATSKGEGGASGTVKSEKSSQKVKPAPTEAPSVAPILAKDTPIEDTSVTVKMPEDYTNGNGLYQFAYRIGGGTLKEFPVSARGSNPVTITGLKPFTEYYIYAKVKGEDGHLDSEYDEDRYLRVTTDLPHVKGTLEISATGKGYRYGETLNAKIAGNDPKQEGTYRWYLVNKDGSRGDPVSEPSEDNKTIKLIEPSYVGYKLEIVFSGTGNYSGEISAKSEIIQLAEQSAPSGKVQDLNEITDSSVKVKLPEFPKTESAQIGYSKLENGVPKEYRPKGQTSAYDPEEEVLIDGLERNTTYYFYLRFRANDKHDRSEWSKTPTIIKTKQTVFDGAISFSYESKAAAPVQGERITARLINKDEPGTLPNTTDGTWTWYKKEPSKESEIIKNFYPGDDGASTYYEIPEKETPGTIYTVDFEVHEDYIVKEETGAVVYHIEAASGKLQELKKEPMTKPEGTKIKETAQATTDTTMTFSMDGTAGLVYSFCYSTTTDIKDAVPAGYDAYTGTNVTIKDLKRDTGYHIWVKVKGNDTHADSDWSDSYQTIKTKKTDILGYVEIEGNDTAGEELKAIYRKANYMPAGNDTGGTWQWYRKKAGGSYQAIAGAATAVYTPKSEDIDQKLKAVYTMKNTDSFTGSKEAETETIRKALAVNPIISEFKQGNDTADSKPSLDFTLQDATDVWYRIQPRIGSDTPTVPTQTSSTELIKAGWTSCGTATVTDIAKDHEGKELKPNTDYILYVVKPETSKTQVSSIVSKQITIGQIKQTGTIELRYLDEEATITHPVVGKTIKATLKEANNVKGTWKWYRSKEECPGTGGGSVPDVKNEASWVQLADGYSPTINSETSTMMINEEMWKHYIKAEFVPNSDEGYGGDSIKAAGAKYVRKIYNETIKIESSTKDGNGAATAYSNTEVKATVENWTGDALKGRFEMYINESDPTPHNDSNRVYKDNTMTSTEGNWSNWNGENIYAKLQVPNNIALYVDEKLKEISAGTTYQSDRIPYKSGVPISNEADLLSFMKAEGIYANANVKCVITKNLNMTGYQTSISTLRGSAKSEFSGELNGDFHTVNYLSNPIFYLCSGTSGSPAVIKNMIIKNAKITNDGTYGNGSTGIITINIGNYVEVEKLFLVQADLVSKFDTGFINGWTLASQGTGYRIEECGSVGGSSKANGGEGSVGGLSGNPRNGAIRNSYSIGTEVSGPSRASGLIGTFGSSGVNIYAANKVKGGVNGTYGLDGSLSSATNAYYDSTITGITGKSSKGEGLSTNQMIGTNLYSKFGTTLWNYEDGYYPRLNWIKGNPVADLYAATRGAFISTEGKTTKDQMFNGQLYDAIQVPEDLQKNGYSYSSSNNLVLKVTDGGTIIPVGSLNSSAKITIRYDDVENGGFASNTYDFTVKKTVKAFDSVSVTGTTNPGQTLTAKASSATSYQWYKRKAGTTQRVEVPGASSSTYTLQPSDVGYEFNVDVSASGYATMSSGYTDAVTSVKPTGISEVKKTDNSITVRAQGISGADYEYAYALSASADKIIAGHSTGDFTISGLARNKAYLIYARVAGGSGYEPSEWSTAKSITTEQTATVGTITSNNEINMGNELRISIGDDNLQTGTWIAERIDATGAVKFTENLTTNPYTLNYTLAKADIGKRLKFTFQATGDFKNPSSGPISYTTPVILRQFQLPPKKPIGTMKDAHTVTVEHEDGATYDFGYTKTAEKDIVELTNNGNGYSGNKKVDIGDLERNTTYYLYARVHENDEHERSDWSPYTDVTTDRSDIAGKSAITVAGTTTVDQTITFEAKSTDTDTENMKGIWVLERVDGAANANTVLGTIDKDDPNKISYQLKPEDAGYRIRATFNANGDYKGTVQESSAIIANAGQRMGDETIAISDVEQHSAKLNVTYTDETEAIYEFGYKKSEDGDEKIQSNNITVTWGKIVEISNLSRNTEYDFYIRKAQRIGYDASAWQKINIDQPIKTKKSPLNGNISVTDDNQKPSVGSTITVSYDMGTYPDSADDRGSGTWQWYLEGKAVSKEQGGTSASFEIPPVDENPEVTVRFIATEESDFSNHVERSFGKVFKSGYEIPEAPTVTAKSEDDTAIGSLLHLTNSEEKIDDVYYYLQESKLDEQPVLEVAEKVNERTDSTVDNTTSENTDHWLQVTDKEMDIRVKANRSYVVYTARLESRTNAVSGINSARAVKSAKEPLARKDHDRIEEADETVAWKTLQSKTLRYTVDGTAPTVSWKYYVSDEKDDKAVWQNSDAEMKALDGWREDGSSVDGKYATSRFQIPLKYTGQYLKITMTGIDDYSGTITHITKEPLEGALITGTALIRTKGTVKLLDRIQAEYLGEDEKNGTFTWYRQALTESDHPIGDPQKIENSETKGNISTYLLSPQELNHEVYAVYTAAENSEYVGSVETDKVIVRQKAQQRQPEAPQKVRVNGNSIQFSIPTNYHTDKTNDIPYVQIGYLRYVGDDPVDDDGNILLTQEDIEKNIHWQSEEAYKKQETWFYGLKRDSDYKLFARFRSTAAYEQSVISEPSETITTEHALFDKEKLMIQTVVKLGKAEETTRKSDIGAQILITYKGEGYDEGEFSLQRSNGEGITLDQKLVETDAATETISYTYTYTKEDVGSYITVEYRAKEDALHYQGSITKTNSEVVTKKVNPDQPEAKYQILEQDADTNLILKEVNAKYEYHLSEDEKGIPKEADWDTLTAKADGSYEFTNLKRGTTYYLKTRIAETDTYAPSELMGSGGTATEPYIDAGKLTITNSTDGFTPPSAGSGYIPLPKTLKKGKLTLTSTQMMRKEMTAEGEEKILVDSTHPISDFVQRDGSATDLVYERGSDWGDENFAVRVVFYDVDEKELTHMDVSQPSADITEDVTQLRIFTYRANAMRKTDYTLEVVLEDEREEKVTANLKADIEMQTQVSIVLPTQIQLHVHGQELQHSTNNEQTVNMSGMPLGFGIDRKVPEKKKGLPTLKGQMRRTIYYDEIPDGEAYLKCANDGSDYTHIQNGVWLDSERTTSDPAYLMRLGADAWSGYYFSGITSKDQTWEFDDNDQIKDAYKFLFIVDVAKEDTSISGKRIYESKQEEAAG